MNKKGRWKIFAAALLCLMMAFSPAANLPLTGTATVQAASNTVKSGLKKENGKYYYYQDGNKVKNVWKTIKVDGKKYKFYFGSSGAAYKGSKSSGAVIKKINGKKYAFDKNAHMVKGVCISGSSFYYFNKKTGVYDSKITKNLQSAAKYEKSSKTLRSLLKKYVGDPVKTKSVDGCYSKYKDTMCYYTGFLVVYAKTNAGKEVFLEAAAR